MDLLDLHKMKVANIVRKDHDGLKDRAYLIEDSDDLAAYEKLQMRYAEATFMLGLRSDCPLGKFDHLIPSSGPLTGIMRMAWHRSQSNPVEGPDLGNNPLYQLIPSVHLKIDAIRRGLVRGDRILANKDGGYMPYVEKLVEIVSIEDGLLDDTIKKDLIRPNSKWIVLENDFVLPDQSLVFLKEMDKSFSIVYDLRGHSDSQLEGALRQFKFNGGSTVFVYTTGLDVQQMYDYTKSIKSVGFDRLVFYFVAGVNREINDFIRFAEGLMDVEVLDEDQINLKTPTKTKTQDTR